MSTVETTLQLFFCHQCHHNVSVHLIPNVDPLCPTCNDGFLEEIDDPNPNLDPFEPLANFLSTFPIFFGDSRHPFENLETPSNSRRVLRASSGSGRVNPVERPDFDPFAFFQEYVEGLRAGGANIQFVFENHPSGGGDEGFPVNLGDYFMGQGLEQLIQQLAENDPNRYGTPPASKNAVEGLPDVVVDDKLLGSDLAQCAVCQDDFEKDMVVKQMPCKHVYHSECLLPWLELHNSCPVCRYELPTDDPDYENRARGSAASGDGNGNGNGNESSGNVRFGISGSGTDTGDDEEGGPLRGFMERTFSIMFRPRRSGGDNNGGGSGSGGPQNMDTN
ncbi:RING-type E3 ubiquitin transferase [Heracleum sosnowskyi]|uniref:RING-type E3 ubiquitin transferase n=1 Tax=Heracleum sosnowskyi TaxID=360622 RepID=A0AAD8IMB1_9APIA|nr:RING-type E3 ubiquitin transferase [Heracleum sosnowskyi]